MSLTEQEAKVRQSMEVAVMHRMSIQTTRRRLIQTASAAAGLVLAPGASRIARAAPRAMQTAAKGGTVTYAYIQKPVSLDASVWSGDSDNQVSRQIFDSLVYSPEAGKSEPWLAESWEMSADGLVYTFKLRKDVTFHDGTPFNAAAVKYTYDRMLDPASKSLQTGYLGPYDRTDVVDDYTVAIHLKQPFGPLMPNLFHVALAPISPTAAKKLGADFAQQPVGTGPFKFDKWVGNDLYLVRNPNYNWAPASLNHKGPAYLDSLIYKEVAEAATRMTVLQTGEANVTHYPVLEDVAGLKDQGIQVFQINTPGFCYCFPLNVQQPPTDDLRVRQAIIQGVDRKTAVHLIEADLANVAYGPLTRPTLGYDPSVETYYPYDATKAGALLDQAGWVAGANGVRQKDGQPLKLEMIMFDSENNKAAAELIQAMLQKLGFDASLDVTAYDAFADHVSSGKYNTAEMNWTAIDPDLVVYDMFSSKQVTGEGQFNRSRYSDPHMDDLIAQGERTADVEERKKVYAEIQKLAMDQALILPLWDGSWITLATPAVQGLSFDQIASPLFVNASVQS